MIAREPIVTERLRLEPIGPEHAGVLWEATRESLEELRPWLSWAGAATPATTREFTERIADGWAAGRDYAFGAFAGDDLVGTVALHTPRNEALGEIGYWTRSGRTSQGFATEAAAAVLAFAFEVVGSYRLELRAGVENLASQRVAEKLGFRLEGTLRRGCPHAPNDGYDCHLYGLLASDR